MITMDGWGSPSQAFVRMLWRFRCPTEWRANPDFAIWLGAWP